MTYLPTTRDEAWRYADPVALAELDPQALETWKEITLAPGEVRRHCTVLDDTWPGVSRVRLTVGEGARAELFAVIAASEYTRLEVEVRLAKGAHFEFGGVTIGGGDATREFVTWYCSEPLLAFNRTVVLRYRIHLKQRAARSPAARCRPRSGSRPSACRSAGRGTGCGAR